MTKSLSRYLFHPWSTAGWIFHLCFHRFHSSSWLTVEKMAAEMSVSGGVAPAITSGRTQRHRFLFLAHLKVGADLEPVFWNQSQVYLCGKRKNCFQSWNQPGTSTGPS